VRLVQQRRERRVETERGVEMLKREREELERERQVLEREREGVELEREGLCLYLGPFHFLRPFIPGGLEGKRGALRLFLSLPPSLPASLPPSLSLSLSLSLLAIPVSVHSLSPFLPPAPPPPPSAAG
jgi:hypothetical protein